MVMLRSTIATTLLCAVLCGAVAGGAEYTYTYPPCAEGISCYTITTSAELTFDCGYVVNASNSISSKGFVYHMHGNDGLQSKAMFFDTMRQLGEVGYNSLACDARGYSPGAAPNTYDAYNYNNLQGDIFSIVDASGLSSATEGRFHVVAHDQGARVAWHAIAAGAGRERFLSFSSLSIPHADVFSDSLLSDSPDADQQEAAQYVRELVLPNSTTFDTGEVWDNVCLPNGYSSAEQCQRCLWWYNGAIDSGAMALAPMMDYQAGSVATLVGIPQEMVEANTQYSLDGVPQTVKVGRVDEFPVLYACGGQDGSDLCKEAFSDESAELIGNYSYLKLPTCGHDVVGCQVPGAAQELIDAIIRNIVLATDE
jgi:pimeloyl-ACP methyl ester carboxylesterase